MAYEELAQLLHKAPQGRSRWTLASLAEALSWLKGRSLACVWKTLQRFAFVYKRGRESIHSPDPDYELKLAYIAAAKSLSLAQAERIVLLYQDELTYYRRPSLARAYASEASKEPKAILGLSSNKKRRISGSLNWQTGRVVAQQLHRFGLAQLKRYYQRLEAAYPQAERIYLVQDNWPVHRHPELLDFFLSSRIQPLFLPTYAPWTNPSEKLWLRLKQELLHLHGFEDDWLGLQTAVQAWLDLWDKPSEELLHYVGLTPD
jgi:DDE superfamily endonuclease